MRCQVLSFVEDLGEVSTQKNPQIPQKIFLHHNPLFTFKSQTEHYKLSTNLGYPYHTKAIIRTIIQRIMNSIH